MFHDAGDAILSKAKLVLHIRSPSRLDDAWKFGVDATNLPDDIDVGGKVVWFQCPWIKKADTGSDKSTLKLVTGFLKHMKDKQRPR